MTSVADTPITAVVDPSTDLFCTDGMKPGRIVVALPRSPDERVDRYSGDPTNPIRPATPNEVAAYDSARQAAMAAKVMTPQLQGVAAAIFKAVTGSFPTPAQMSQIQADTATVIQTGGMIPVVPQKTV